MDFLERATIARTAKALALRNKGYHAGKKETPAIEDKILIRTKDDSAPDQAPGDSRPDRAA